MKWARGIGVEGQRVRRVEVLLVGAGTAGMPLAVEAAAAGVNLLVVEQADRPGGTLWVSAAQMSGAGTGLQRARGIEDSPEAHFADVRRISRDTCRADLVARATALGGPTIDWLIAHGFRVDPACPAILHFHEAYRTPRTYWGVEGGRSVLEVLAPLFEAAMRRPNAELRLGCELVGLLRGPDGAIGGGRMRDLADGSEWEVEAEATVLATGGYGADPDRFARWTGGLPLYTAAMETSTGSGIALAEACGAQVAGGEHHLPTFAGIVEEPGGRRILWDHLPVLTPQNRPPWEIYVDRSGRRFVREDVDSVDARERALRDLPGLTFWAVFDEAIWRTAPPLLPGWSATELDRAWRGHDGFTRAGTLDELAARCGIAPEGLRRTVAEYNNARAREVPDALGRVHRPAPIAEPPFRAIRMHGMVLKTAAGLVVDVDLRVLDSGGRPIGGLFALGEAIGGATLSGNAFVGGMSVTPALGFGRWLGVRLADPVFRLAGGAA